MSKKSDFIDVVEELFRKTDLETFVGDEQILKNVLEYFESLKVESPKPEFTEMGAKILSHMQVINAQQMTANAIGEGIFLNSRSVSGAMKKLIADGYVDKTGDNPKLYSITDKGLEKEIIITKENE